MWWMILAVVMPCAMERPTVAPADSGMVASAHPAATAAGVKMLELGGNAVDAAVATTLAISVVEPFSAGIGGGGFAVVRIDGAMKALDFREVAPAAAQKNMYVDDKGQIKGDASLNGPLSIAVPGTIPGLHALHKAHGKLPWKTLFAPAIDLAANGFVITDRFVEAVASRSEVLQRFPSTAEVFFKKKTMKTATGSPAYVPLQAGDRVLQKDLAATLRALAKNPQALQQGPLSKRVVSAVRNAGGILSDNDMATYQPRFVEPLCGSFRGHRLCTMPPPSSGGVHLLQILAMLDGGATAFGVGGFHDEADVHRLIESMRLAYADRAVWLGDPRYVNVPTAALIANNYLNNRQTRIGAKAMPSTDVRAGTARELGLPEGTTGGMPVPATKESADTSHLSVVDAVGNAVSLTFTVNYGFGSGFIAPATGILMNDEMDDFVAAPGVPNSYGLVGGDANSIAPGKVPLSSMTPMIAEKDGQFFMTAGAPGGSTIITTVLQTFLHVAVFGMDCQAAVNAPRVHQQWVPEATRIEAFGLDASTQQALVARGHKLQVGPTWGNGMCIRRLADGRLDGGADVRGEGTARGARATSTRKAQP
jgi:gamma-glutamyltranspeptidase / glutathione hydrolase